MTVEFVDAVRENIPLLISIAGGTGSGKTFSAMRLAKGLAGGKKFAVVDTENKRALHYAPRAGEEPGPGQFSFAHFQLRAPYHPHAYMDAILSADEKGYPVILVDSFSHEHEGDGGLLDMHAEEHKRLGGKDSTKMTAWIKPKAAHKDLMQALLQVKAHVILCFRAAEKIEMVKNPETNKTEIRKKESLVGAEGWVPICEKSLPYEMTLSFLCMAANPGVPLPIKLQEQHKPMVPLNQPLSERTGELLAAWSRGEKISLPNLNAILQAFKVAETMEQLKAAAERARDLPDDEKERAKQAYKAAAQNIESKMKSSGSPSSPTSDGGTPNGA